jgi:hypothetical protein
VPRALPSARLQLRPFGLFTQTSHDLISVPAAVLISLLAGIGVALVVLRFRRSASAIGNQPLLPIYN